MKRVYMIGGTMGIGKTTICQELNKMIPSSVFLDGDWCWNMNPFVVNDETKRMVLENIIFMLNQFINCSVYENVVFCWVMHEQSIIDTIINNIDTSCCEVKSISLLCDENTLTKRLLKDIKNNLRSEDIIKQSVARLPMYQLLDTIKIDTSDKDIHQICNEILCC